MALGGVVRIELVENTGAFLSLGGRLSEGVRFALFVVLVGAALAAGAVWLFRGAGQRPFGENAGVALIVGGGVGNLIDRIARGRVVDLVQLRAGPLHTGVFNLADAAIVAGIVIWALTRRTMEPKGETS